MRLPFFRSRKSEGFLQKKLQDGCYVAGWARNLKSPHQKLRIDIFEGKRLLGSTLADMPRNDLISLGKEDGCYGFLFRLPADIFDGKEHTIRAIVAEFGETLRKPITICCESPLSKALHQDRKQNSNSGKHFFQHRKESKPLVAEMFLDGIPCGIRRLQLVSSEPSCSSPTYQVEHPITSAVCGSHSGLLKLIVREARDDDFAQLSQRYEGACEPISGPFVRGWAYDKEDVQANLLLEMLMDGNVQSTFKADKYRANLAKDGIGDGHHGFLAELTEQFYDGKDHELVIRVAGTDVHIGNSPIKVTARHLRNILLTKIEKRLLDLDTVEV